jgi:amidase
VSDLALSLSVLAEPGNDLARPLDRDFRGVRVAWFRDLGGIPFDSRVRSVVDGQRAAFESLGCVVEEAEPDFSLAEVSFRIRRAWNSAVAYRARGIPLGAYKDVLRAEIEEGLRLSASDLARAELAAGQLWRGFQAFLTRYEYFALPTVQVVPFDVDIEYPAEFGGYIDWMKSCWYISATGNPAASVPAGFTAEGWPVGLQIVGRDRADVSVLQMAYGFEQTAPPFARPEFLRESEASAGVVREMDRACASSEVFPDPR